MARWVAMVILATAIGACGPAPQPPPEAPVETVPKRRALQEDEPAPPFQLTTSVGETVDSAELLGKRALVVVFFATWCRVCDRKLPMVREVLDHFGDEVSTLLVSLDDVRTYARVPSYLEKHGLRQPVVRGAQHASFVMAYDPSLGIPHVVVVGRDGKVVDVQSGWAEEHHNRLRAAVEVARLLPPRGAPDAESTTSLREPASATGAEFLAPPR